MDKPKREKPLASRPSESDVSGATETSRKAFEEIIGLKSPDETSPRSQTGAERAHENTETRSESDRVRTVIQQILNTTNVTLSNLPQGKAQGEIAHAVKQALEAGIRSISSRYSKSIDIFLDGNQSVQNYEDEKLEESHEVLDIPDVPPLSWQDRKLPETLESYNRGKGINEFVHPGMNVLDFVKAVYSPWVGVNLVLSDIRRIDDKLYQQYSNYLSKNKHIMPILPTMADLRKAIARGEDIGAGYKDRVEAESLRR